MKVNYKQEEKKNSTKRNNRIIYFYIYRCTHAKFSIDCNLVFLFLQ